MIAELENIVDGKISFEKTNETKLEKISEANIPLPVAGRAHRMNWVKGTFKSLKLVTDANIFGDFF